MPVSSSALSWESLLTAAHAWQFRPSELRKRGLRDWCWSLLSPDERQRYEEFTTNAVREEYLATRFLCRTTLSKYTGVEPTKWRFAEGLHGKPALAAAEHFESLRFNLTHTSGLIICVVTRAGEVGVDAEDTSRSPEVLQVARHFLPQCEEVRLARLSPRERTERFFEQWVLKEAYIKASGLGLSDLPERFGIDARESEGVISYAGCQLSLHRPDANHVAAVAVLARRRSTPISFEWMSAGA